ncbi:MAG: hypothetical protein NC328_08385 [Muribaculum sp.]|nr:hypothetical protein [Muribaculum sp.]
MAQRLDDNNGIFSYERSFKDWLEDIFSSGASSDYPSRLRKFFSSYYEDGNILFKGKPIYKNLDKLSLEQIRIWLDNCLLQAGNLADSKEGFNIRSAINKFSVFLEDKDFGCDDTREWSVDLASFLNKNGKRADNRKLTLDNGELRKKFLAQFRSEDRRLKASSGMIYPIKAIGPFINTETKDKARMTRFFKDHIDNIKILLGNDSTDICRFKDITSLSLDAPDNNNLRKVTVLLKDGKDREVYTKDGKNIVAMRVAASSEINRDHDKAIANILENLNPVDYPRLYTVSEVCRDILSKKTLEAQKEECGDTASKKAKDVKIKPSEIKSLLGKRIQQGGTKTKSFAEELFKEIDKLYKENEISFTLMEGRANRKKSASV